MRNIELVSNEEELNGRIEQLKSEGVNEEDITVVSREGLDGSALGYTAVNFRTSEGSAWDKIVSWFSDEDPEERVMTDLDVSGEEEEKYRTALERGEILLHVNRREEQGTGMQSEDDEGLGTTGVAGGTGAAGAAGVAGAGGVASNDKTPPQGEHGEDVMDTHRADSDVEGEGTYSVDEKALNSDDTLASTEKDSRYDYGETETGDRKDLSEEERLQLREEQLNVDKENVQTGEVNVDKHVETEHEEFNVPVEREEVSVERRPVEGDAKSGSLDNGVEDNDSVHVPVNEERVNVEKENVVNEEVVIKKDKVRDTEHVSEDVQHEEVDINESDNRDRELRNRDVDGNIENEEDNNLPGNDGYRR
ncbi:YsnF/AvaK domain-containing protein [Salinicoccus sp. HZC-1]|uniref:YsnF/AvaK domain-containing protein n=1 Tax=Salinicoccus sp. HZC-1 TaxID=3385497 RepID=UPI00398B08E8